MTEETGRVDFLSRTIVVIIGAFICCALWGSAFPGIKIGYKLFGIDAYDTGTQILFAGIRFALAGILVIVFGCLITKSILVPKRDSLGKILKLSFFQTVAQYVLFYIGLAHTTGVRSSIVEGMNVFVAILIASLIFKQEKLTFSKMSGCLIGFAGVVLINLSGAKMVEGNYFLGDVCVFLSTIAYAFSSVLLKRYSEKENTMVLSGYQFVVGGVIMIIAGWLIGGRLGFLGASRDLLNNETVGKIGMIGSEIAILVYLAFVSAMAYSLWGILLKHNPISRVAVFGFMTPVCGFVLSALLLNEGDGIGVMGIASLILVCAGIYIVNREA